MGLSRVIRAGLASVCRLAGVGKALVAIDKWDPEAIGS